MANGNRSPSPSDRPWHTAGVPGSAAPDLLPPEVRARFAPAGAYLNAATYGLAPIEAAEALIEGERARVAGRLDIPAYDEAIAACRGLFGGLVGVTASEVAVGSQVSQFVGLVAASLAPGSVVVVPAGEFTSVTWPFLARTDLDVRAVPVVDLLEHLAAGAEGPVDVVATSVVQSADGAVVAPADVVAAARAAGARLLLDVTQAAGWYPVEGCREADWVVGGGYKWLLAPRGTAFFSGTPEALDGLRPLAAGWFAGDDPWVNVYGTDYRPAPNASRFDVSPAWGLWPAQRIALDLLHEVGIDAIGRHDLALAGRFRAGLGLPPGDSAIVSVEAPDGAAERLAAAGVVAAVRAGRIRLSFHLWNTEADVDAALDALAR